MKMKTKITCFLIALLASIINIPQTSSQFSASKEKLGNRFKINNKVQPEDISNQKLDSIVVESADGAQQKEVFIYDEKGNIINSMVYIKPSSQLSQWGLFSKTERTYDKNNQLLLETSSLWNLTQQKWLNFKKQEWIYNTQGNQICYTNSTWDETQNLWVGNSRYENTYDIHGFPETEVYMSWDKGSGLFQNVIKNETYYDEQGYLKIETEAVWNAKKGDWEPQKKQNVVYGPDNYASVQTSIWDPIANRWINDESYRCVFDSNGKQMITSSFKWNISTNEWVNLENYNLSFDEKGCVLFAKGYIRKSKEQPWEAYRKYQFAYDENSNLLLDVSYAWDSNKNDWSGYYQTTYMYDNNNQKTQETHYDWDDKTNKWVSGIKNDWIYNEHGSLKTYSYYEKLDETWYLQTQKTFYYKENLAADNHLLEKVSIYPYPNPASESVYFDLTTCETETPLLRLADLNGKIVLSSKIKSGEPVSISKLSAGTYIYHLTVANKAHQGKLIVK